MKKFNLILKMLGKLNKTCGLNIVFMSQYSTSASYEYNLYSISIS